MNLNEAGLMKNSRDWSGLVNESMCLSESIQPYKKKKS